MGWVAADIGGRNRREEAEADSLVAFKVFIKYMVCLEPSKFQVIGIEIIVHMNALFLKGFFDF